MNDLRIGSLCSGYGGLDMAVQAVLGGELAWVADPDPGAAAILTHHHPDVPNLGDITTITWEGIEPVDILCAGFPCQDISNAGKRGGIKPGTRSGLWSEVFRAIVELRPQLVVLENVSSIRSGEWDVEPNDRCVCGRPRGRRGLYRNRLQEDQRKLHDPRGHRDDSQGQVDPRNDQARVRRADREVPRADGPMGSRLRVEHPWEGGCRLPYEDRAIPAAEVRAGSGRAEGRGDPTVTGNYAYGQSSMDGGRQGAVRDAQKADARVEPQGPGTPAGPAGWNTLCAACGRPLGDGPVRPVFRSGLGRVLWDLASVGLDAKWTCVRASDVGAPHQRERWFLVAHPANDGHERVWLARGRRPGPADRSVAAADAQSARREGPRSEPSRCRPERSGGTPADTDGCGRRSEPRQQCGERPEERLAADIAWGDYEPAIRHWERILGRPAPSPTEPGQRGNPRLSPRFSEWLMGLPAGHVTDVPGLSRNQQLKALGNGVVPQQAIAALQLLLGRMEAAA